MRARRALATAVAAVAGVGALTAASALGAGPSGAAAPAGAIGIAAGQVGATGTWFTDPAGRVVILHGLNQVYKVPPYEPSADGFGDDDAAFLQANGFDAMRIGVIWAAVEPTPGHYDDAYLAAIAATVHDLAQHGIVSVLDFHQDLYNEKFQGEGAPAWAVEDGGLPNPALGFPGNYLGNPAEWRAWDNFWNNAPAPDGIGLQDHYAAAWQHVAATFAGDSSVVGYELMNEPWPGTLGEICAIPLIGCSPFDSKKLTPFYQRVATAIRAVDPTHTVWIEPNVLFTQSDATYVGPIDDPHTVFAFHDYCSTEEFVSNATLCKPQDDLTVAAAVRHANGLKVPAIMTEFGATQDLPYLSAMVTRADKDQVGWLEWAYSGNDKTSSSPDGQALVLDPSQPPTGANVLTDKLEALAEPYPQAVAGTPSSWSFSGGTFRLTYSTARVGGGAAFPAGSETDIAVPAIQFPAGYAVSVSGAHVVSAAGATELQLCSDPGARTVTVSVTPA